MSTPEAPSDCAALARTLDLLGDRWTLLIIRELAVRPCRYTDLRDGLPGIATNLLADRLRELQAAGVISAEHAPAPVASTLYALTEWGAGRPRRPIAPRTLRGRLIAIRFRATLPPLEPARYET